VAAYGKPACRSRFCVAALARATLSSSSKPCRKSAYDNSWLAARSSQSGSTAAAWRKNSCSSSGPSAAKSGLEFIGVPPVKNQLVVVEIVLHVNWPDVRFVCAQLAIDLGLSRNTSELQRCRFWGRLWHGCTDQRAQVRRAKSSLGLGELHGRQQFGCATAFVQRIRRQHFGA